MAIVLGLAAVTLLALWPLLGARFIDFDDDVYVTSNPHVVAGLTAEGVAWAFTTLTNGNWHPLTWLSHMLDVQIFGLVPAGHHATSLLLHALAVALLFLAIESMTGATGRAAFVAALFALHPLHVESVAWIAERKDVLSGLCCMLTLLAYARYAASHSPRWYAVALAAFSLGLLAKPMLVTVPFVLLLLDDWPLGRLGGTASLVRLFAEKVPFFALTAVSCVITFIAQQHEGAVSTLERMPVALRLTNAILSYATYLGKVLWPQNLAVFYPLSRPQPWPAVLASLAVLAAVSATVTALRRRAPYLLTGWLWYLGMLVPVIGLVQIGSQAMADRYTYLPLIGIFLAMTWGAAELLALRPALRSWTTPLAGAVLVASALLTLRQAGRWKDSQTLFTHALSVTANNWLAHANLGVWYFGEGRTEAALSHFQEAVRLAPDQEQVRLNFGTGLARAGRPAEAIPHLREAARLQPGDAAAHYNLGAVLMQNRSIREAESPLREAIRLDPLHARAHSSLGGCLLEQGRVDEALEQFARAVALQPSEALFRLNIARGLARAARRQEAIVELHEALRLSPGDPQTLRFLQQLDGSAP